MTGIYQKQAKAQKAEMMDGIKARDNVVTDYSELAKQRIAESRARYGFNEVSDQVVMMAGGQKKGYVSGFREIREKARAAKLGDKAALGEIEAAKALRASGQNVHFQTPIGKRSYLGNTADFLIGGQKGTGAGGIATDVFTPMVGKRNSIISAIAGKTDQAQHIIVNLKHAKPSITATEIGNPADVLNEVIKDFANSYSTAKYLKSVRFLE